MIKRLLAVILILAFLSVVITPAHAESQADKDARQGKAVLAAIGIVALVGAIFMISRMSSKDTSQLDEEKDNKLNASDDYKLYDDSPGKLNALAEEQKKPRVNVQLDFSNAGYIINSTDKLSTQAENELRSPELKLTYAW